MGGRLARGRKGRQVRILRVAATVVGVAVAIAAAIPSGGTSLLGAALGVSSAAAGAISAGANLALSVGTALLTPKPKATSTGSPEQWSADPEGMIPYVMGRFGTSGSIVFRRAWDTGDKGDNDRQAIVTVLSGGGPIARIESTTFDQAARGFDSTGKALGDYSGWLWQTTQLGAIPTTVALTFGDGAGTPPNWGPNRYLHGLAAVANTFRFDTKDNHFQNGLLVPKWTVLGVLCYDPRKDSTYPGGSGSHRWADPADTTAFDAARATWEYSANPYLHGLRWALGVWERDPGTPGSAYVRTFGIGMAAAGVDMVTYVEGANIADLNGWKIGGEAYSGDGKWDTLKKILQAGMGEPVMLGAKLSCFTNAPKVSLATVTPGDIAGDASCARTQSRRDRINRVVPRYYQEAQNWQLLPGTPVAVPDYYAIDEGQRTRTIDYQLIPDADGGKQIATACRYDIENAREFGPIVLPLKIRWLGYKPGDCITVNDPEIGLNYQSVLLTQRDFDPATGTPTFTARSETAAKHAFALGQTTVAPPTPGVSGAALVPMPGSSAWAISGTSISPTGQPIAALVVTGAVDSPVAEQIVIEYRPWASGQLADYGWISAGVFAPDTTRVIINSVMIDTPYEVAVSYRRHSQTGERTIYGPATTSDTATQADHMVFIRATTQPSTPTGDNTPTGWSDGLPAGSDPVWMSVATQIGGITQGAWSVPQRVSGEDGAPGAPGTDGTDGRDAITYFQDATPSSPVVGDTWCTLTTRLWRRWNGSTWVPILGALAQFDLVTTNYLSADTIVARHFVTDQGVDLAALVPGTLGNQWGPVTPLSTPLVNPTDGGSVSSPVISFASMNITPLHRLRFVASISGYVTSPDFTNATNYSLALYIRINGGAWVSTGLSVGGSNLGNSPQAVSVDKEVQSTWTGAADFGVAVGCWGKAGAVLSGSATSMSRLEVVAWK